MSGGSYNYLCHSWDLSDLMGKREDLEAMAVRLAEMGRAKDAAMETRRLIADLNAVEVRVEVALSRLRDVWKAVEWRDSADWGDDAIDSALVSYRVGGA